MIAARWGWVLLLGACSGGGEASVAPALDYGQSALLLRVGEPVTVTPTVTGGAAAGFVVTPTLPAGLTLRTADGAVVGTPTVAVGVATYEVAGVIGETAVRSSFSLGVGRALPVEVAELEAGFVVERVLALPQAPSKMALAPDGRVFVSELATGSIRIVAADGSLVGTPFATVPVVNGGHRGLHGIALSPGFATDGLVFAIASTPAGSGKPGRTVLYRWQDVAGRGQNQTVLRDDLPVAAINNGGALCFDASGMLLVTLGDTEDPALAQQDGSLAGKVLRLRPTDGGIPGDNPDPTSPVFAKGLRNVFALTRHPTTGALFAADNGPASDDQLLLLQAGRNFGWGAAPGASFGAEAGVVLRVWPTVVVPTGLAFRDPGDEADWPAEHERSLYLSYYDDEVIERLVLSGALFTDIDRESTFLRFVQNGVQNKPLDIQRGPDGRLWILTFGGLFRVDRLR